MNTFKTIIILTFFLLLTGCSSLFTLFEEVAVDKLYIKKQCPTFQHEFMFTGKKYNTNITSHDVVVMPLQNLIESLEANKKARETFNSAVREMNKDELVKDSEKNPDRRVVKKIYVDQECPKYFYVPAFKAKKLTSSFNAEEGNTYVVIDLDEMVFQITKHSKTKEIFNTSVDDLNSKPFPENILPN